MRAHSQSAPEDFLVSQQREVCQGHSIQGVLHYLQAGRVQVGSQGSVHFGHQELTHREYASKQVRQVRQKVWAAEGCLDGAAESRGQGGPVVLLPQPLPRLGPTQGPGLAGRTWDGGSESGSQNARTRNPKPSSSRIFAEPETANLSRDSGQRAPEERHSLKRRSV